jgi:porphobilinogen synthase
MMIRPRRLRRTSTIRRMVKETCIRVDDLIYPLFVKHGKGSQLMNLSKRQGRHGLWAYQL